MLRVAATVMIGFFAIEAWASDFMPIAAGQYMQSPQLCSKIKSGEWDFVDFEVEDGGRAYGLPEIGCVVASVQQMRPTRYMVEADCLEAGQNVWQQRFILDVVSGSVVRMDGVDLHLCSASENRIKELFGTNQEAEDPKGGSASADGSGQTHTASAKSPAKSKPLSKKERKRLIEKWHTENEDCRGGFGDDPDTYAACERREQVGSRLRQAGWCYGKDEQPSPEFEWHACGPGSFRE